MAEQIKEYMLNNKILPNNERVLEIKRSKFQK
jgi:hypothetical protein